MSSFKDFNATSRFSTIKNLRQTILKHERNAVKHKDAGDQVKMSASLKLAKKARTELAKHL